MVTFTMIQSQPKRMLKDFIERFDVIPDGYLSFDNYVAKDAWRGERTILNGNLYSSLNQWKQPLLRFIIIYLSLFYVMLGEKTREKLIKSE